MVREADEGVFNLDREFAGRGENQGAGVGFARGIAVAGLLGQQQFKNRRRKRQGLAGSRLGAGNDIVTIERERYDRALDGSRAFKTEGAKTCFQPRVEAQLIEGNRRPIGVNDDPWQVGQRRCRAEAGCAGGAAASATASTTSPNGAGTGAGRVFGVRRNLDSRLLELAP